MSNMKCEVIRDLMPLMADDVASPASVELVSEHMETCETCKAYYAGMKAALPKGRRDEGESAFVQFAKKEKKWFRNRKRMARALVGALLAAVIAFVGYATLQTKMNMYVEMDIEHAKARPFSGDNGALGLLIEMQDGYGWYWRYGYRKIGETVYIMPEEPEWKLWNRGATGTVVLSGISELYVEDGKVYNRYEEYDVVYNAEMDHYEDKWTLHMEPIKYIRWGTLDSYTTLYEEGDAILTYEDIVNGTLPGYVPEVTMAPPEDVPAATVKPAA